MRFKTGRSLMMQTRTVQEMMWQKLVGLHLREKGERGVGVRQAVQKKFFFFFAVKRVQ